MKKVSLIKNLLIVSIILNICLIYFNRKEIKNSFKGMNAAEFNRINTRIFYYSFDSFQEIKHTSNTLKCSQMCDSLILEPNLYLVDKLCFDLTREGLYRVINSDGSIRHIIVHRESLFQLLSSLSWIVTHGNEHNKLDFNGKQAQAINGKLFLTCSRVVAFAGLILERNKIKSRVIQTFASKDLNGYDDEHVLLEVFDPKIQKWILIDIDNNVWFSIDKVGLSLFEYKSALDSSKNIKIEKLSNDALVDISNFKERGKNFYGIISENVMGNENLIKWHKRIMDIVTINKVYYNEKQINYMTKNKPEYSFKNHNDFLKEFYKIY